MSLKHLAADIAAHLVSMNYGANVYHREATHEKEEISRVYLRGGSKSIDAYIDLSGNKPEFKVFASYPEGHNGLTGEDLKKFNSREAARKFSALKDGAMLATTVAMGALDADGLEAIKQAFRVENRDPFHAPWTPGQDAEANGPDQAPASTAPTTPAMREDIAF